MPVRVVAVIVWSESAIEPVLLYLNELVIACGVVLHPKESGRKLEPSEPSTSENETINLTDNKKGKTRITVK